MRTYLVILFMPLFVGCQDKAEPIDLRILCQSWVFENTNDKANEIILQDGELVLVPLKSKQLNSGMGMRFEDTGKLVQFRIVNGKKQELNFIPGLWTIPDDGKLMLNLNGTKPIYSIIEFNESKLRIKKDAILAD